MCGCHLRGTHFSRDTMAPHSTVGVPPAYIVRVTQKETTLEAERLMKRSTFTGIKWDWHRPVKCGKE